MTGNPVRTALHAALSADDPLADLVSTRIYLDVAPEGAIYPLVIFHAQAPERRALRTLAGPQAKFDLWTVKGVATGSGSATQAEAIDAACEAALDGQALAVTGRDTILKPMRDGGVRYADASDGTLYRYVGGLYRLITE